MFFRFSVLRLLTFHLQAELEVDTRATTSNTYQDAANKHTVMSDVHPDISNAEPVVSEVRRDATNTRIVVYDPRPQLKSREDADGQNQAVSATRTPTVTRCPPITA